VRNTQCVGPGTCVPQGHVKPAGRLLCVSDRGATAGGGTCLEGARGWSVAPTVSHAHGVGTGLVGTVAEVTKIW